MGENYIPSTAFAFSSRTERIVPGLKFLDGILMQAHEVTTLGPKPENASRVIEWRPVPSETSILNTTTGGGNGG